MSKSSLHVATCSLKLKVEQKVISCVVVSPCRTKYSFKAVDRMADANTFAEVLFFLAAFFKSIVEIDSSNLVWISAEG